MSFWLWLTFFPNKPMITVAALFGSSRLTCAHQQQPCGVRNWRRMASEPPPTPGSPQPAPTLLRRYLLIALLTMVVLPAGIWLGTGM